jgi:hypothetical protein
MTDLTFPPSGLGIPDEDWEHTPESVRRAIHLLTLSGKDLRLSPTQEERLAAIEEGFGLLADFDQSQDAIKKARGMFAGHGTVDEWYAELKERTPQHRSDD